MASLREILRLPQPHLIFNRSSGAGTILARAGKRISVDTAAAEIAQTCCPSCRLFRDNNQKLYAVCNGMDKQSRTANVKKIGRGVNQAVTVIFTLSECAPRE